MHNSVILVFDSVFLMNINVKNEIKVSNHLLGLEQLVFQVSMTPHSLATVKGKSKKRGCFFLQWVFSFQLAAGSTKKIFLLPAVQREANEVLSQIRSTKRKCLSKA